MVINNLKRKKQKERALRWIIFNTGILLISIFVFNQVLFTVISRIHKEVKDEYILSYEAFEKLLDQINIDSIYSNSNGQFILDRSNYKFLFNKSVYEKKLVEQKYKWKTLINGSEVLAYADYLNRQGEKGSWVQVLLSFKDDDITYANESGSLISDAVIFSYIDKDGRISNIYLNFIRTNVEKSNKKQNVTKVAEVAFYTYQENISTEEELEKNKIPEGVNSLGHLYSLENDTYILKFRVLDSSTANIDINQKVYLKFIDRGNGAINYEFNSKIENNLKEINLPFNQLSNQLKKYNSDGRLDWRISSEKNTILDTNYQYKEYLNYSQNLVKLYLLNNGLQYQNKLKGEHIVNGKSYNRENLHISYHVNEEKFNNEFLRKVSSFFNDKKDSPFLGILEIIGMSFFLIFILIVFIIMIINQEKSRKKLRALEKERYKKFMDYKEVLMSLSHDVLKPIEFAKNIIIKKEILSKKDTDLIIKKLNEAREYGEAIRASGTGEDIYKVKDLEKFDLINEFLNGLKSDIYPIKNIDVICDKNEITIEHSIQALVKVFENILQNNDRFRYHNEKIQIFVSQGELISIKIVHKGPPIEDNLLPDKLFEIGVKGTLKSNTGIGLYTCKQIINKIGGDITAKNLLGQVEFDIKLPFKSKA